MKLTKKLTSWILTFAMLMSVCVFQTAEAAVDTLQATDVGLDYITIEWPAGYGGGVHFKVSVNGGESFVDVETGVSYTFNNLEPDTEYDIVVVPTDDNWVWLSGGTHLSVRTAKPETPYATVTKRTSTSIEITLSNVDEDGTYFIYSETDDGEIALAPTQFTGTVFVDENLQPGTNYHYTIYPDAGDFDDILISATTVPEYKIEATEVTENSVSLEWVQKEGSRSTHKLRVEAVTAGAVVPDRYRENTDVEGTSCTVTGLTPDSEYTFIVTSLKTDAGWTFMDSPYRITVKTEPATMAYATVTNRTANTLTIELSNADTEDTYYISAQKEDGTVVLDNAVFTGTTYVHTGLEAETTYNYTIQNEEGTVSVSVSGSTMPVYKIEATEIGETSVTLSWTRKENSIEDHRVKVSSSTPGANIPEQYIDDNLDASIVKGTTVTISGLTPGAVYDIRVTPMNGNYGWLDAYNIQVTTLATVTELTAVRTTGTEIELRWPEVADAAYYVVTMEDENGAETVLDNHNTSRSLVAKGLKIGKEYIFYVDAYNQEGSPVDSMSISASTQNLWNNDNGAQWYADYTNQFYAGKGVMKHDTYYSTYMSTDVGFNIYLPADYETSGKTYPVIYMLHGLGGNENTFLGEWGEPYANSMKEQEALYGAAILVYVNGANFGWYTDSVDGTIAAESTIVNELIPYVDANYRTNPTKAGRAIDGFSMGGQGAFRLAFKYPELFSCAVSYAGGFAESLDEFSQMGWTDPLNAVFRNDTDPEFAKEYYDRTNAYALLEQNIDAIKASGIKFKIITGENDFTLPFNDLMAERMLEYGLISEGDYIIAPGFDHSSSYYGQYCAQNMYWYDSILTDTAAEPYADQVVLKTDVRSGETNESICTFLPGQQVRFAVSVVNNTAEAVENATVYVKIQNQDDPTDLYIVKSNSVNVAPEGEASVVLQDVALGEGRFYDITYYVWDDGMKPYALANHRMRNNF